MGHITPTISPLEPLILSDGLVYELGLFEEREVYRFYANKRRKNCTLMEVMNLWLIVFWLRTDREFRRNR